jgi:hypothetical protein
VLFVEVCAQARQAISRILADSRKVDFVYPTGKGEGLHIELALLARSMLVEVLV